MAHALPTNTVRYEKGSNVKSGKSEEVNKEVDWQNKADERKSGELRKTTKHWKKEMKNKMAVYETKLKIKWWQIIEKKNSKENPTKKEREQQRIEC